MEKVLSGVLTQNTAPTWSKPLRSSTSLPHMPSAHHPPPHPGQLISLLWVCTVSVKLYFTRIWLLSCHVFTDFQSASYGSSFGNTCMLPVTVSNHYMIRELYIFDVFVSKRLTSSVYVLNVPLLLAEKLSFQYFSSDVQKSSGCSYDGGYNPGLPASPVTPSDDIIRNLSSLEVLQFWMTFSESERYFNMKMLKEHDTIHILEASSFTSLYISFANWKPYSVFFFFYLLQCLLAPSPPFSTRLLIQRWDRSKHMRNKSSLPSKNPQIPIRAVL